MGIKEELKAIIDELSEDAAESLLHELRATSAGPDPAEHEARMKHLRRVLADAGLNERGELPDPADLILLKRLFQRMKDEGPDASDEEWAEFGREFDSHRPHRPVFFP